MNQKAQPFLPTPISGRVFTGAQRVRLGDAAPDGRLRFDGLARYLQDVAEDDAADANWPSSISWVMRRIVVTVRQFPVLGEALRLDTFCSATGPRWAERTTTITGAGGGSVQAIATWVAIGRSTGRPVDVGELFDQVYGPSAGARRASVRLYLPAPSHDVVAKACPWPLRATDFDVLGHVNNAISWAAIEDGLALADWPPANAEVEYNAEITPGSHPSVGTSMSSGSMDLWILDGERVLTSARLRRLEIDSPGGAAE